MDNRSAGPRYLTSLLVRAEWEDEEGSMHIAEGEAENVGPEGALVHLQRELPNVGSRVKLAVLSEEGERLQVITEVLRLERNPGHPLAALQLIDAKDEWRGLIWEPASQHIYKRGEDEDYDEALH
jgi:hypothetical protein